MKIEQIIPKKLKEALVINKPRSEFTEEDLYQDLRARYGWDDATIASRLKEFPDMFNQDWGVPRSDPARGRDEQTTNQGNINILGGDPEGIETPPIGVGGAISGEPFGDSATDDETSEEEEGYL